MYYKKGECKKGRDCQYLHPKANNNQARNGSDGSSSDQSQGRKDKDKKKQKDKKSKKSKKESARIAFMIPSFNITLTPPEKAGQKGVRFGEWVKHKERTTSRRSRPISPRSGSRNENLSVMPHPSPDWLYEQEHSSRINEKAARTKAWNLHKQPTMSRLERASIGTASFLHF